MELGAWKTRNRIRERNSLAGYYSGIHESGGSIPQSRKILCNLRAADLYDFWKKNYRVYGHLTKYLTAMSRCQLFNCHTNIRALTWE
jgi:hypothetical protein